MRLTCTQFQAHFDHGCLPRGYGVLETVASTLAKGLLSATRKLTIHTRTRERAHPPPLPPTHTLTHKHTHTPHARTHTYERVCELLHAHTQTHARTRARTQTDRRARAHTRTHTHTHHHHQSTAKYSPSNITRNVDAKHPNIMSSLWTPTTPHTFSLRQC